MSNKTSKKDIHAEVDTPASLKISQTNKNNTRILFFINNLDTGGKERRFVELVRGLSQNKNISIAVVLFKKNIAFKFFSKLNIRIYFLERNSFKDDIAVFSKFYFITLEYKPKIIHAWSTLTSIFAVPASKILNIPLINSSISYAMPLDEKPFFRFLSSIIFNLSDFVIANSNAGLKVHGLKKNRRTLVIPNGYDFKRADIDYTDLRKELDISEDSILIGMIGNFREAKDYISYVKVADRINSFYKNIHFLCVGDGSKLSEVKSYVKKKKIKNTYFLGFRPDIINICLNLDIGVLLTNTSGHAEGLSNSIIEMMASRLPVVATNAGGTPELINDGIDGSLVKAFDVDDIFLKISYLIDKKVKRKQFGLKAMKKIKKSFSLNKMVERYEKIYLT